MKLPAVWNRYKVRGPWICYTEPVLPSVINRRRRRRKRLSRQEKLQQLEKILSSRAFRSAESLRAFLDFAARKAIEGTDGELKEYTIATEVFGRDHTYDPRTDSLVRVQASRLRAKLRDYYAGEGKLDPVQLELPKGHYRVVFSSRIPAPVEARRDSLSPSRRSLPWVPLVVGVPILLLAGLSLYYQQEVRRLRAELLEHAPDPVALQLITRVWGDFLDSSEPVVVAYSNTIFEGTPETGMKLLKPLDDPGHGFGVPILQTTRGKSAPTIDHYTGVGEVAGVYSLGNLFWTLDHPFRVKRSLLLTWDDLKASNIVVLGSPAENILLRELPQQGDLVFRVVKDGQGNERFGIVNLHPKPGESSAYFARDEGPSTAQLYEDYALVSMLRGLDANRRLLMLAGIKTVGTQAAAEYMAGPRYLRQMVERLAPGPLASLPPYYQVLLRVKVNGGVPVEIHYVTHHVLS